MSFCVTTKLHWKDWTPLLLVTSQKLNQTAQVQSLSTISFPKEKETTKLRSHLDSKVTFILKRSPFGLSSWSFINMKQRANRWERQTKAGRTQREREWPRDLDRKGPETVRKEARDSHSVGKTLWRRGLRQDAGRDRICLGKAFSYNSSAETVQCQESPTSPQWAFKYVNSSLEGILYAFLHPFICIHKACIAVTHLYMVLLKIAPTPLSLLLACQLAWHTNFWPGYPGQC